MTGLTTYWHTLRYLRPQQIYGRVLFRLAKPAVDQKPAPSIRTLPGRRFIDPARRCASMLGPERFRFLNVTHDLVTGCWDDPALPKLWRYNLHYFDDLNAEAAESRSAWHRALLQQWVRDNPAGEGTGWEPYPTSLRIVNWIKWALSGNQLPPNCVESLAAQARWLSKRLERHLLGNHLFSNAKALIFAGLYFEGPEANAWLDSGLRILEQQIPEQILSDGGHFERSTMYHALALEDMVDIYNVASMWPEAIPARWRAAVTSWASLIAPMRHWLAVMSHPDGEIALFNDAALGIAPTRFELERYAARLGLAPPPALTLGLTQLAASGYIRVASPESVAIIDVAPIGPDYLPAHAHADTLSFELSVYGQRVLVNSGTSEYGVGAERLRQRGTRAHNTVVVNGQDSSQVWGGFRVAQRARPVDLTVRHGTSIEVRCSHDGYRRLPGRVLHTRRWQFDVGTLVVDDGISGAYQSAEAIFHLHPSVKVAAAEIGTAADTLTLLLSESRIVCVSVTGGTIRVEDSTWHPRFGVTEPSRCLIATFTGASMQTRFTWESAT